MPTGRFQDAMNNGGVLDKFHHELSYTNTRRNSNFRRKIHTLTVTIEGSHYILVKISKQDAFGVKNLEMYASAGYEAHKTGRLHGNRAAQKLN